MTELVITDSQVHIWKPDTPDRPWPEGTHAFAHGDSFSAEELLRRMDEAGVARAMLVPPSWEGDYNDYCAEAAAMYPDRFAVAGRVQLQHAIGDDELRELRDRYSLKGLRFTFARGAQREWLTDGTADWMWGAAERLGIPVFIYAPSLTAQIDQVMIAYPDLKLTLDHLALNTIWRDDELTEPIEEAIGLARHPNLAVKASCLPSYLTDGYPYRSIHDRLHQLFDAYGPDRMFWGSDISRLPGTYREAVTMFTEELDFLSDVDMQLVMGKAFSRRVDWPE